MIKLAGCAIKKIFGNVDIRDKELQTASVGAKGQLNSRPLTYQSSSADVVLTLWVAMRRIRSKCNRSDSVQPKETLRYVQELIKRIWHRWLREFSQSLMQEKML